MYYISFLVNCELPKLCHCLSLALNNAVAVAFKIFYSKYDNLDLYLTLQYMYSIFIMSQRSSETMLYILQNTIHSNSFCRESFFGATCKGSRSPTGCLTKSENILKNRKRYESVT